jgi:hypothetical protein
MEKARAALGQGDPRQAFALLRDVLSYPNVLGREEWQPALLLFAEIAQQIVDEKWAEQIRAAARNPEDINALYQLGYALYEQQLFGIGAMVLSRALEMAPGEAAIVTELSACLEHEGRYAAARSVVARETALLARNAMCQYLLAFNTLMCGEVAEAKAALKRVRPELDPQQEATLRWMVGTIGEMITRAEGVGVTALDLRGWQFATTGSVLLHVSPYGLEGPMYGRYAFLQDTEALMHEGILRIRTALGAAGKMPERVFVLADRTSAALGLATATVLGVPAVKWPALGSPLPGLVVADDLRNVPVETLKELQPHRRGQTVWAHATCWTEEGPFAADIVTFLYQTRFGPWEAGRMRMNAESKEAEELPAVEGDAEDLAKRILATNVEAGELSDLGALRDFVLRAMKVGGAAAGGAWREEGNRRRQRIDSPVPSARFR